MKTANVTTMANQAKKIATVWTKMANLAKTRKMSKIRQGFAKYSNDMY